MHLSRQRHVLELVIIACTDGGFLTNKKVLSRKLNKTCLGAYFKNMPRGRRAYINSRNVENSIIF
jgi:hypothetical protein